jgi:hypothetical protein
MNDEAKSFSERIPFVMLIAAVFFRGLIFITVDGPLFRLLFSSQRFTDFFDLFSNGICIIWETLFNSQSAISSFFTAFLIIILFGFFTTPIQQIFTVVSIPIYRIIKNIFRKKQYFKDYAFYSPFEYPNKDFIKVLEWLSYNPMAKAQWEWQQFYYHLWWSFCMSFFFSILLSCFLITNVHFQDLLVPIFLFIMSWSSAFYFSCHMGKVHRQTINRMEADNGFKKTFYRPNSR